MPNLVALDDLTRRVEKLEAERKRYVFERLGPDRRGGGPGRDGAPGTGSSDPSTSAVCGPVVGGAVMDVVGSPWPSSITWWRDAARTVKISEELITRDANQTPTQIQWRLYDAAGALRQTVTDTITIVGTSETSRSRVVT